MTHYRYPFDEETLCGKDVRSVTSVNAHIAQSADVRRVCQRCQAEYARNNGAALAESWRNASKEVTA